MKKIALIGHDTRNPNLGVGALTVSNIEILHDVAARSGTPVEVTVLVGPSALPSCVRPDRAQDRVVRPLRQPWDFFRAVRAADVVLDISGGDSFADIYGDRRIFQIMLQKVLVHLAGRPLVMSPQTMGPFKRGLWRRLAARTVRCSAIVASRDDKSTAFLREIGVQREIIEASDVALRLPFDAPAPRPPDGPVKVGLNVSGLLMAGGYTGKNMFGLKTDYAGLVRDLISGFQTHDEGCEVHLVGHVIPAQRGGPEDDYQACLDLAQEFPGCVVAPAFQTPSEAKTYIAGLDFFMGARMHACIGAFSSGVPVVPMAYSRKFEGLFGALGYDHVVDCTRDSAEDIREVIFAAFANRAALRAEVETALALGRARLKKYEDALEALLRA